MNINLVVLSGHMTRDQELRYTPKGTPVGNFALACNRTWKNDQGEKQEEVSFIDCVTFGRTAEVISEYLKKGSPLMVEGRLKQETWTDKESGGPRSKLKVIVERFHFVPVGGGKAKAADGDPERAAAPSRAASAAEPASVDDSDSVPF